MSSAEPQSNATYGTPNKLSNLGNYSENGLKEAVDDIKEVNKMLKDYDVILKVQDENEEDNVEKYETYYDKLSEEVIKRRCELDTIMEEVNKQKSSIDGEVLKLVTNKAIAINKLIDCCNRINQRIKDGKIIIFNRDMKQLNESHMVGYDIKNEELNTEEMNKIMNCMDLLKEWSGMPNYSVLFDSIKDSNGSINTLHNKVIGKSNLYFISIDECCNIYGGYLSSKINTANVWIGDEKAFIFSLYRVGESIKKKYPIDPNRFDNAFQLSFDNDEHYLYNFGSDIVVYEVGYINSYCDSYYYLTSKEHNDLVVDYKPHFYSIKRIIVIQMN